MIKKRGELSDRIKAQLAEKQANADRHQAMVTNGLKSFGVINGAGVVAMLGFIQALIGNGEFSAFKYYGLTSLGLFMFGAFFSALIFFTLTLIMNTKKWTKGDQTFTVVALTAQVVCALGGAYACVWGIHKAF
jgi:hypothetical protein